MIAVRPPQPSLFKRQSPRVGVLRLPGRAIAGRGHRYTYGLDAVCDELDVNIAGETTPDNMGDYDIVMCSLTSPMDALRLALAVRDRPRRARLIVGGQGAYAFLPWRHLTHRIVFGRAEGVVNGVVLSVVPPRDYCYDYDFDPEVSRAYHIRQPQWLLPGEQSVGCTGRCRFCQYGATRRMLGDGFRAAPRGASVVEDRWQDIAVTSGRQMTALDGWSESTRRRVCKEVSDDQIVETLSRLCGLPGPAIMLKCFQIVGYPWETAASVEEDVHNFRALMGRVRPGRGRVMMMITCTPFSPEPLTAMEDDPADITTDWRGLLLSDDLRCIYDSAHLNVFCLPQIPGPLTLYRRVAANRCGDIDTLRRIAVATSIGDATAIGGDLHARGGGERVSAHLSVATAPHVVPA